MATARAFIAEGARVLLAGVSEPELRAGAAELGEQAAWRVTDVTDSVNTIHPGPVDNEFQRRVEEAATGATLPVDGGMSS